MGGFGGITHHRRAVGAGILRAARTEDDDMGPLEGIRLLEIAGIGPGPYCAMVLADMGAEVVRVVRPGPSPFGNNPSMDLLSRGRRSICVDLKRPEGADTILRLCERDVVDVVSRSVGERSVLSEAGHAPIYEPRIARETYVGTQAESLHHTGSEALEQSVGALA